MRWNALEEMTYEVFLVLCAIGEDDERMREFERMIELGSEEKKEEREVFVGKKRRVMENIKR